MHADRPQIAIPQEQLDQMLKERHRGLPSALDAATARAEAAAGRLADAAKRMAQGAETFARSVDDALHLKAHEPPDGWPQHPQARSLPSALDAATARAEAAALARADAPRPAGDPGAWPEDTPPEVIEAHRRFLAGDLDAIRAHAPVYPDDAARLQARAAAHEANEARRRAAEERTALEETAAALEGRPGDEGSAELGAVDRRQAAQELERAVRRYAEAQGVEPQRAVLHLAIANRLYDPKVAARHGAPAAIVKGLEIAKRRALKR